MKDCREKAGHALARPIGGSVTWALCPAPTTPSITNSNDPPTLTSTLYSKSSDTNHFDSLMIAQINFFQVTTIFFYPPPFTKKNQMSWILIGWGIVFSVRKVASQKNTVSSSYRVIYALTPNHSLKANSLETCTTPKMANLSWLSDTICCTGKR